MALNNAEYIDGLSASDPTFNDKFKDVASHLRAIKKSLKQTFPNFNSALDIGVDELNAYETRIAALEASLGNFSQPLVAAGQELIGTSDGAIAITGVGFTPTRLLIMAHSDDSFSGNFSGNYSIGFYDGTTELCFAGTISSVYSSAGDRTYKTSKVADIYVANEQDAGSLDFTSFDSDGFTLTKTGTTYSINMTWVAFE